MTSALDLKKYFSRSPVLIIDKHSLIGEALALKLAKEFLIFIVSAKKMGPDIENKNIVHIPFLRKFPVIPDNKYSHIIVVDEENEGMEFFPSVAKKARDVNSELMVVLGLSEKNRSDISRIMRTYSASKIFLLGDVFGPKIMERKTFRSAIDKYFYQAHKYGRIQILGDGLRHTYPIFLEDVIGGIINVFFGLHKSCSLFYLFSKHPTTELSLAHMIQKANPEITVDFVRHDLREKDIKFFPGGLYLLEDRYPLAKRIGSIDIKEKPKNDLQESLVFSRGTERIPLFLIGTVAFLLAAPFVFAVIFSFLGNSALSFAKGEFERGNMANARTSLRVSNNIFYFAKQASEAFVLEAKVIGQEKGARELFRHTGFGYSFTASLLETFNSQDYLIPVLTGRSKNAFEDLTRGKNYLKNSLLMLDRIKAEEKIPAPIFEKLDLLNPVIKFVSATSDILPDILAIGGEKKYLILFQDNLEIRPSGGIITHVASLIIKNGKIAGFQMVNSKNLDEKLRGHLEPPFAIRRYLPAKHWYLRDSSFDFDFAKSASAAAKLYSTESNQGVDGVVGLDNAFIKKVLEITGPVYLKDFNQLVDKDNFYELLIENGSLGNQKKDFFVSLVNKIIESIVSDRNSSLEILQVFAQGLVQKNILFWGENWGKIFTVNNWSSSLWDERENNENAVNDFVAISEANLGNNKANYFLKRSISQRVVVDKAGRFSEELSILYKNEINGLLGGDYKNYLRIALPEKTKLLEVSINNNSAGMVDAIVDPDIYEAKGFKKPVELEVDSYRENGKEIFGFLVVVPKNGSSLVKLSYLLPGSISDLLGFSYSLKFLKQPGIDSVPYSLSLEYPQELKVIDKSTDLQNKVNGIYYSNSLFKDENFFVSFSKK